MNSYGVSDKVTRSFGKDAQRNNILAAKVVAEIVKSTLGPKGMDKLLVDSSGEIIVTNDGVTILNSLEIDHPAAKMLVEVAKTQESEVGDGTTTAALLAGKLLERAEILLDKKIHPTIIVKGYNLASRMACSILNEIGLKIQDKEVLKKIAMTAMTGKGAEIDKEKLSEILVNAVDQVAEGNSVSLEDIKIEKVKGEGVSMSELVNGFVLNKERAHKDMPKCINNAKILLIDFPLEIKNSEREAKISISSPEQLENFIQSEEIYLKKLSEQINNSGANVVFCQKGIDDVAQYYLAKHSIMAFRRVTKSDLEKLSRATGGKIVSNLNEISVDDFGNASKVEQIILGDENLTRISGCVNPHAVSIILRGGTGHVLDEVERAVNDALGDLVSSVKSGFVVAGGGAIEMELSKRLRNYSKTLPGREQLAVEEFANALECIPEALAENAGLDPIDILVVLRKKHESGEILAGLNLFNNQIENTFEAGIIEPLKVKTQAVSSASEVATMILRIDDVLISDSGKHLNPKQEDLSDFD